MESAASAVPEAEAEAAGMEPAPTEGNEHANRAKPQLQLLPIGRDTNGRSPLVIFSSSPSSRANPGFMFSGSSSTQSGASCTTPKMGLQHASCAEAGPGAGSSTAPPTTTSKPAQGSEGEAAAVVVHTQERAVSVVAHVQSAGKTKEVLSMGQGVKAWNTASIMVACHGTPTGRAMARVYYPQASALGIVPCAGSTEAVFAAVESHTADRAVLPVESSLDGTFHRTYDLLLRHPLHIVGELPNLQTSTDSITRFWVLGRDPLMPTPHEAARTRSYKTTLAIVLSQGLRSLHKVLAACSFRGVSITKVESRPWRSQPLQQHQPSNHHDDLGTYFQYVVFMDFHGSTADRGIQSVLAQVQQYCTFMRVLGSYPVLELHEYNALRLSPRSPGSSLARTPRPHHVPAAAA